MGTTFVEEFSTWGAWSEDNAAGTKPQIAGRCLKVSEYDTSSAVKHRFRSETAYYAIIVDKDYNGLYYDNEPGTGTLDTAGTRRFANEGSTVFNAIIGKDGRQFHVFLNMKDRL